ncbi:MAG: HCNGP-like protein-domain-containing protein [Linnemannia gamsii]|nr:MAG: HCNGP-like protein-domain-containing protein [Linnemannia gamsii]
MNKGIGLVAYGDSDSDSSDEEMTMAPSPSTINSGPNEAQRKQDSTTTKGADSASERPNLQDTISARSIVQSKPIGQESLNKLASTNLLKQGLAQSSDSIHIELSSDTGASAATPESSSTPVHGSSFLRSGSGTPLPADHSAASEVFNTPTTGRSPQVPQTSRVPIADEAREEDDDDNRKDGSEQADGDLEGAGGHGSRAALMRVLLRPKPIPGIENFGIPPSPESEVNPDVQAKIEHFYTVKRTRGMHFNESLMKNKNFRNPRIYQTLVEAAGLNEIGTNFPKSEFFDIEGYGPASYATGIAEAQKQASEKLAQQQAMGRTNIQFVSGSTVPPGVTIVPPPAGLSAVRSHSGAMTASTSSTSGIVAGGAQRPRKSKWDTTLPAADDHSSKRSRQ